MGAKVLTGVPFLLAGEVEDGNLFLAILNCSTCSDRELAGVPGLVPSGYFGKVNRFI
jgi:hypothetical protein